MFSSILFKNIDKYINHIEKFIISMGLISISLMILINIMMRYFFGISFTWSEELARYIMVWITFVGISACVKHDDHVKIEVFISKLSDNARRFVTKIVYIISMAVAVYLMYLGLIITIDMFNMGNRSITIGMPIWLVYLSVPVGAFLMSYQYIKKIINK